MCYRGLMKLKASLHCDARRIGPNQHIVWPNKHWGPGRLKPGIQTNRTVALQCLAMLCKECWTTTFNSILKDNFLIGFYSKCCIKLPHMCFVHVINQ